MEFILASSNAHKAEELNELLKGTVSVTPATEKLEVVEDGDTFEENAYKKAYAYYKKFNKPTVADDSGLVVEALPDDLGLQSARFAPELPDYKDKNEKLIKMLQGKVSADRAAYFTCVLCFIKSEDEVYFFEGRVHGEIGEKQAGEHGFGYDPVFYPSGQEGKSMAQLPEWKMQNSHRAKASHAALKFFQEAK
jgi:XTP/dITP diphosphohydrolase